MFNLISLTQLLSNTPLGQVIELLDTLLTHAANANASDIHIDPTGESVRIRFRVDGLLLDVAKLELSQHAAIVSRIKVLSALRTDEHQAAQDGRFQAFVSGTTVDVRVAISPTYHGERAILRLLQKKETGADLRALGMSELDYVHIKNVVSKSHGLILAAGPTGSGKTTTLYTLLQMVQSSKLSIVTIEDPVEYALPGACQIQVNSKTSLTFASGLRSILRQDPNIIMVGEIRDTETARLAVNSALTGHLIFSTIHTNDAATTLLRLLDLGIEGYLVASTVTAVVAQRLVRAICRSCAYSVSEEFSSLPTILKQSVGSMPIPVSISVSRGKGCADCMQTGYTGRTALFEVLYITPAIRALVLRKASVIDIARAAVLQGMTPMSQDALAKVINGVTTPEEVARVLQD